MKKRIVVTGIGAVSSIGIGVDAFWRNLMSGVSGIRSINDIYNSTKDKSYAHHFAFTENAEMKFKTKCLGLVTEIDMFAARLEDLAKHYGYAEKIHISPSEWNKIGLYSKFAVGASLEALLDAGVLADKDHIDSARVGVYVGNTIGGSNEMDAGMMRYATCAAADNITNSKALSQFGPMYVVSTISNLCASYVSMAFGLHGPNAIYNAACASANLAIATAADYIRSGRADIMVCGGSDRSTSISAISGFDAMSALSRWDGAPSEACKPYHQDRDGFLFADGAGIMILEELEHALARQERARKEGKPVPQIYCEYLDHGMTSDAGHISRPAEHGVLRAMSDAIKYSGIMPSDITHVTAHGTSTPVGDACELKCIEKILNTKYFEQSANADVYEYITNECAAKSCADSAHYAGGDIGKSNGSTAQATSFNNCSAPFNNCVISAVKSSIGHTLGAAAGMQNVALAKSLRELIAPPILNLELDKSINPHAKYSLLHDKNTQKIRPGCAMSNSFGFGGVNVVSIWKHYSA